MNQEMEITESLKTEHRIIEKILGAMDNLVEALQKDYDVPVELIRETINLIRDCSESYHQVKEDTLIFPYVEQVGANGMKASITKFVEEHVQNKSYYRNIMRGADKIEQGDTAGRKNVIDAAKAYSTALRRHIQKEDRGLFPAIEKRLKDNHKRKIWEMLEEYEDRRLGQPDLDEFEARTRRLVIKISDVLAGVKA